MAIFHVFNSHQSVLYHEYFLLEAGKFIVASCANKHHRCQQKEWFEMGDVRASFKDSECKCQQCETDLCNDGIGVGMKINDFPNLR